MPFNTTGGLKDAMGFPSLKAIAISEIVPYSPPTEISASEE